ncbi:MAG: DUF4493 domain-containing protein [Parabacteroides sp.]|nr:DUF4493 domain-containing protein [Parabacteroides sp.]
MRPFTYNIYPLWLCLLLLLSACMQEDLQSVPNEGEGVLKLGCPTVIAELSSSTQTKATASLPEGISAPDASNFQIAIYDETGTTLVKENVNTTDSYVLPVGKYMVKVTPTTASNPVLATTTAPAYFEGSTVVEIKPLQTTTASVTVYWGYSILNVTVDEELDFHLKEYSLVVTKDGKTTEPFNFTNKELKNLYVLANTKVLFTGTNYVGEVVSKELLPSAIERAKQYDVTVSLSDLQMFSLTAVAEHTKDKDGYLNGTSVKLNISSDVPAELISWTAELKKEGSDEVYRTYSSDKIETEVTMTDSNGWPYIPKGTYTLNYTYTMNGTESSGTTTVTVPAPEFEVFVNAYTSYDKYAGTNGNTKNITEANACDSETLYDIKGGFTGISQSLIDDGKYGTKTFYIEFNGTKIYEFSNTTFWGYSFADLSDQDQTGLDWKAYSLVASMTFDGTTVTKENTHYITGLPYSYDLRTSSTLPSGWTVVGDTDWDDGCGQQILYTYNTSSSYNYASVYSPQFKIPESDIDIKYEIGTMFINSGRYDRSAKIYSGVVYSQSYSKEKESDISNSKTWAETLKSFSYTSSMSDGARISVYHDEYKPPTGLSWDGTQYWMYLTTLKVLYN